MPQLVITLAFVCPTVVSQDELSTEEAIKKIVLDLRKTKDRVMSQEKETQQNKIRVDGMEKEQFEFKKELEKAKKDTKSIEEMHKKYNTLKNEYDSIIKNYDELRRKLEEMDKAIRNQPTKEVIKKILTSSAELSESLDSNERKIAELNRQVADAKFSTTLRTRRSAHPNVMKIWCEIDYSDSGKTVPLPGAKIAVYKRYKDGVPEHVGSYTSDNNGVIEIRHPDTRGWLKPTYYDFKYEGSKLFNGSQTSLGLK